MVAILTALKNEHACRVLRRPLVEPEKNLLPQHRIKALIVALSDAVPSVKQNQRTHCGVRYWPDVLSIVAILQRILSPWSFLDLQYSTTVAVFCAVVQN